MDNKGLIPREFIDDLLTRIDIVSLITTYVPLKKAGTTFKACCPFHDEKTPSFTVSPQKQTFHCFGCDAGGNAISFLMDYSHLNFPETIDELASIAGVQVPKKNNAKQHESLTPVYDVLLQSSQFFQQQLQQDNEARSYIEKRQLDHQTVEKFAIGYAPPGWDALSRQTDKNILEKAGLIIKKDQGRYYDRFRKRLIFPIRNPSGKVIAFGGRRIDDNDNPKYLNSPETPVFSKSNVLYGIFEMQQSIKNIDSILVVEGYMDVVALSQHGVNNAVATLGTAITSQHIKTLFQRSDEVVFCFDGDIAGQNAAWKALTIALPLAHDGRKIKFLHLPEGEDPDSVIQKNSREDFLEKVKQAQTLSTFLFEHVSKGIDLSSIDGKAAVAEKIKPILDGMPDSIYKKMLLQHLSKITELPSTVLTNNKPKAAPSKPKPIYKKTMPTTLIRSAIGILLQHPEWGQDISTEKLNGLELPGIPLLIELITMCQNSTGINTAILLQNYYETEHSAALQKLSNMTFSIADQALEQEFVGTLQRLEEKNRQQLLNSLLAKNQLNAEEKNILRSLLANNH
jgi:DNA primase